MNDDFYLKAMAKGWVLMWTRPFKFWAAVMEELDGHE